MAVYQNLYVDEVAGSVDVNANTSEVRILWTSQQTYDTRNYTPEYDSFYWVSINGGPEEQYNIGKVKLPLQETTTILNETISVKHRDDGSATIKVRTYNNTETSTGIVELSSTLTLSTIPRPSEISAVSNVTLGNACSVKWTPKSASFRYKLKFTLGSWSYTTEAIHPNTTAAYTYTGYQIPMDVANQIPKDTGTMAVTLYTYSDADATKQVSNGDTKTFTVTVPNNADTKPLVQMTIVPDGNLPSTFDGLYIQGKMKVKASKLDAQGKYGATVESYSVQVDGKSYGDSEGYTSEYLDKYGSVKVYGYATDTRGFTGSTEQDITVISYSNPKIVRAENETEVIAARCDKNGDLRADGTYLKIKAARSYSKVIADGVQKNFCEIRYRWKTEHEEYSEWVTILAGDAELDEVTTGALSLDDDPDGDLNVDTTYIVQVGVVDDIGGHNHTTIIIPTDKVYCHRDGARGSFAFGGYVVDDKTFSIANGFAFKASGGIAAVDRYNYYDFDDMVHITGYYVGDAAPGSVDCNNYPVDKVGVLEVIAQESLGVAWQTYKTCDGEVYMRSYSSSRWTPWGKLTITLL